MSVVGLVSAVGRCAGGICCSVTFGVGAFAGSVGAGWMISVVWRWCVVVGGSSPPCGSCGWVVL